MNDFFPDLLVASLAVPLALLGACFVRRWRRHALALQWLAPIPALATGLVGLNHASLTRDLPLSGFTLRLDPPGALLLAGSALLWIIVSAALWRDREPDNRFGVCWLLTMIGNIGVFVAGDLIAFYLFYALASIPAYGLFAFSDDSERKRAGAIYMAFTILGEALLLLAFAMLVAGEPHGSTRIADVMEALAGSPWRDAALGLIVAGFGMKIGMIPFNGWMPLNYSAAPIPAAAVLSGAGVKAGVIGLIRFLPLAVPLLGWGEALAAVGFLSAFYGVVFGLTQRNPKVILAYSSISQMGVITAALGMALVNGQADASVNVAFYGANHLLVKATLFLVLGALVTRGVTSSYGTLVIAALLALSLAGFPLTGGALAKLALKAQFAGGSAAVLATLSSIGTALLMTHFLICLAAPPPDAARECPASLTRIWYALALGAILLPWTFHPAGVDASSAFEFGYLLDGLWPVALGVCLALGLARIGRPLPQVPVGDSIVLEEAAFRRLLKAGPSIETLDAHLRQWPAAGVSLLLIILALLAASASRHA
jgi:formate hydrogenlyase subunit 3/multisubunit Na+/H+ antiporter MnhD subunit